MTGSGRRHTRTPSNEPASIAHGSDVFDGKVTDISTSGAAIEFNFGRGESRVQIDLGEEINVESKSIDQREGRVVRHYDGGFAVNFDGFRPADD